MYSPYSENHVSVNLQSLDITEKFKPENGSYRIDPINAYLRRNGMKPNINMTIRMPESKQTIPVCATYSSIYKATETEKYSGYFVEAKW